MTWRVSRFPILASTNDLALSWMRAGRVTAGDVLVATEQTSGRGRHGRVWHSSKGALLFTAIVPFRPERAGWAALSSGVAVARAVRELGAPAGVKWPNDVVLEGRKLAGILVETAHPELAAVGVGMNVTNPLPDDPELARRAARLADAVSGATPEAVLEPILAHLEAAIEGTLAEDLSPLRQSWAELDTTTGRRVCWIGEGVEGSAEGVDDTGALRIRADDGRLVIARVGEVAFL